MDRFFSFFGKFVLIVLVGGGLVAGGFYLGNKLTKSPTPSATVTPSAAPKVTQVQATPFVTQQPQATGRFAVTAGGIKPFAAYTLSGVGGWTPNHETSASLDRLTLTKGNYSVVILQTALGGGGCSFPGTTPAPMSIALTSMTEIPLLSGSLFRRGQTQSPTPTMLSFVVCQKASDGSYGTFTDFGVINYTTPANPDVSTLAEMDAMIGSLEKK